VQIDIRAGAQSTPAFLAINPMMKVPALTDGPAMVAESGAICAYVADRVPEAGLAPPLDDPARGRYLQWLFFAAGCIEAAYTQKLTGAQMSASRAGWGDFDRVMSVLEAALAPGAWILGEHFSAADIMLGSDLHFGINFFKIVDSRPAFAGYLARCAVRPAFQRALAIDDAGV
jgi:glutathione S-transferase